jgi:hypothetical protein
MSLDRALQQLSERERGLEFYRRRRGELVIQRDRARDLLNNWLAWFEQDGGLTTANIGNLVEETRAAQDTGGEG